MSSRPTQPAHIPQPLPKLGVASGELITAPGGAVFVEPYPAPHGARVLFFTRLGGVSTSPFGSLNVSLKYGDDEENVRENRRRVSEATGGRESAFVRQVAGDEVVHVSESGYSGEADALITCESGLPLEVGVADCVPVALIGRHGVAMVHSGWRGTLSGISEKVVRLMVEGGEDPSEISAYIGPSIRKCCYEVSQELADDFRGEFGESVMDGRMLSLQEVIVRGLRLQGVGEIHDMGLCTGCRGDLFYSHRMQKPLTGRSLAVVMKTGEET